MNYFRGAALTVALSVLAAVAVEAQEDAAATPAVMARLAERSLLIDLAWAGERAVAVGERGHILVSDDRGASWKQVPVPASAGLTAVYFADPQHGWAVGHDELVLRTEDGGLTWERTHFSPDVGQPLLDVWFADAERGLAVGAYGAMYASTDGGRSWTAATFEPAPLGGAGDELEEDDAGLGFDFHLNAIVPGQGTTVYLGAEAGRLFRSDDGGATWRELPSPYDGSFYGLLPLDGEALLAFGLRGHVFRSEDGGQSWSQVGTGTTALLNSAIRPTPDLVLIAGLTGVMLASQDGGHSFTFSQQDDRKGLAALLWLGNGEVIAAGESGVRRLAVPGLR